MQQHDNCKLVLHIELHETAVKRQPQQSIAATTFLDYEAFALILSYKAFALL